MSSIPNTAIRGSYTSIPKLTADNFSDWDLQVATYLMGAEDYVCVITPAYDETAKKWIDPKVPDAKDTDATGEWKKAECVTSGVIMATARDLHRELLLSHHLSHGRTSVWSVYKMIQDHHQTQDALQRYEAWSTFLAVRKCPEEQYMPYVRRMENAWVRIARITPPNLTLKEIGTELILFNLLNSLPEDDRLRQSLITQKDLTFSDASTAMLRVDTGNSVATEMANAAFGGWCYTCKGTGHIAANCPHHEAITQLIVRRNAASTHGHGKGKWRSNTPGHANAATPSDTAASQPMKETAGVATLFLSSSSHLPNDWLCDSGASSTMSGTCSAFQNLKPDHWPIRLADGKVVYSEGSGSISFCSKCGYIMTIHDMLFVPCLLTSLFAANKFARHHRHTLSEITEYPKRKWVNRHTGATELTATIRENDLAYLDWKVILNNKAANITIEELHTRLNHLPFPAV